MNPDFPSIAAPARPMHGAPVADRAADEMDRAFAVLRNVLRPRGGIARTAEVAAWLEARGRSGLLTIAGHARQRELFSVDWDETEWLPLFQFAPFSLRVRPAIAAVLEELSDVFDGWTLATWFVTPNSCLDDRCPVDLLDADMPAVVRAARTDRFIASGSCSPQAEAEQNADAVDDMIMALPPALSTACWPASHRRCLS
jgi:hypothetical protein